MTPPGVRVSAVISTRDRANVIRDAVYAILQNDHPEFELIVADQSADGQTEAALAPLITDPRLRYVRTATAGKSAGLNAGIRAARGALVATTDDDCRVPPDWLRQIEAAFAVDRRIGIVFGNVLPAPQDRAEGRIPSYIRQRPFLARGIRDKNQVEGLGACMAVRRDVWQSLGGFDELLGIGARFSAGEDGDLALRALLAGHWIHETPSVWLTHYGLRKWDQMPALIESYWRGTGAMMAKPVRAGRWQMLPLLLRLAARWAVGTSTVGSSLGPQPKRIARLLSFCRGFLAGLALPVDRKTGLFVAPAPGPGR
jgi:glycosyltransferase involved in cell wall biosynthesis